MDSREIFDQMFEQLRQRVENLLCSSPPSEEQEEVSRLLYDFAPAGHLTLNEDCRIIEINHTGTVLLGAARSQILGKPLSVFFASVCQNDLHRTLREALASSDTRSCDLLLAGSDGGKRLVSLSASAAMQAEEGAPLADPAQRDLPANGLHVRQPAPQPPLRVTLTGSELRYRSMIEHAPEGIMIVRRGRVIFANHLAARFLRAGSPEDLIGVCTAEMVEPASELQARSLLSLSRGGMVHTELALRCRDGRVIEAEAVAAPVRHRGARAVQVAFWEVTERKRLEREIALYQRQLRKLATQVTSVADEERQRLAGEIHDTVGQLLGLVHIKLDLLRGERLSEEAEDLVDELKGIVDSAIEQTRTLTHELSPPVLRQLGLDAALEWLAESSGLRYGFTCRAEDDGNPKPINNELKMFLYQSVRELVHNAARHASASEVTIISSRLNGSIKVSVADNGRGFDPGVLSSQVETRSAYGLFTIRVRLEEWGGHLLIDSDPGEGTTVTMIVPL